MIHPPQEHDIVPGRGVAAVGLGIVASTIAGVLAAYWIGGCRIRELGVEAVKEAREPAPAEVNHIERRIYAAEAQGLDAHREAEIVLSSYGWVDREHQIVRIPIERAYSLVIARQRAGAGPQRGGRE